MRTNLTAEQFLQSKNVVEKYKTETAGVKLNMEDLDQLRNATTKKSGDDHVDDNMGHCCCMIFFV